MFGPTGKYYGSDPGQNQWPGTVDGFPVRDPSAPLLKQHEYDKLVTQFNFHSEEFQTWVPDKMSRYNQVMDAIANGYWRLIRRLEAYDQEHGGWRFWVEYAEVFGAMPAPTGQYEPFDQRSGR